jgi:hypothetical protein
MASRTQRYRRRRTRGTVETFNCRSVALAPATLNDEAMTVRAVLATEDACISMDMTTGKAVLEVYLMTGMESVQQVPLCDTHKRDSIERVMGSVRDIITQGNQVEGVLAIASAEYAAWSKIRDRHITDVSAGFQPLDSIEIKAGQSKEIQGKLFTAPSGRSLFVHTRWRLREVSLTPIGSDQRAKIRSLKGENSMNETIRKWLEENAKLRAEATPEEAQTFWDAMKSEDRTRAEEACRAKDDEETDDEEEEDEEEEVETPSMHRVTRNSVVTTETRTAEEEGRIRAEGIVAERRRVASIRKAAANDVPAEIVTRAIDEGWTVKRFRGVALETVRAGRTKSVGGGGNVDESDRDLSGIAIHSRNRDTDCTISSIGAGLLSRSYHGTRDLTEILGAYQPTGPAEGGGTEFVVRSRTTEAQKKAAERLLDMGDRYRSMSMMETVEEANRMEGRARTSYDPVTRIRAAMSGSALSAIFTQNISALFLGGYLDAADTTQGWTTEAEVPNFLINERAIYGKMGQMKKLAKGGTADDLDTSDWNEVYKIARYAGKFIVDEQDIINDRFGAIEQMTPQDMGLTARQIRPNLVYALLLANAVLNQDGGAVFNSTAQTTAGGHDNIVTGAITDFSATIPTANAGPLQDATTRMGKQRIRNRVLNLRPRYCIAGTDLEWALNILYKSQQRVIATASGGTFNPLAAEGGNVEVVLDGRLDPLGCYSNDDGKTYYPYTTTGATTGRAGGCILAARPGEGGAKTIEVGYLRGSGRAPRIRSSALQAGLGQYGFAWDVNLDIGAKILDYRGFVLLTGGGSQLAATGP